jgi:hypothetical protein
MRPDGTAEREKGRCGMADDNDPVEIRIDFPEVPDENPAAFYSGVEVRGLGELAAKVTRTTGREQYAAVMKLACATAAETAERLAGMDEETRPDEFEVTFAMSVNAAADVKIVNLGSAAQVQVRMQWNRRRDG